MSPQQIEWVFAIAMLIVGVSHLVNGCNWADAFAGVFASRHAGFIIALYSLPIGLILALGSRGWVRDVGVIVTLYGWALIIKSAVYLWFPSVATRVGASGGLTAHRSRVAGVMMIAIGLLIGTAGLWPGAFGR